MRALLPALVILCTSLAACMGGPPPRTETAETASGAARTPAVPPGSAHYDFFEGTSFKNDCAQASDCVAGGCGKEVCSAEAEVITSCIAHPDQPKDASCGCVNGQCLWYR